ncbi:NUDIX hydrolase [Roseicella aquatilis]|uniref:NUDIX hydrolase n=1 Tax=Roseicella aquatilis TaxID=2527868 RepID=A0A4R4D3U5_9PROT|nr:NUDIX hydrolase [Roseicella aquatilis]TCZ51767.1 NUDIX hydrolase [Roseicella aquatilis]
MNEDKAVRLCNGAAWGRSRRWQCAALPLKRVLGLELVLLVTTRRTGRWIIPKGWLEPGIPRHVLAAREAYEEAGVLGTAGEVEIGTYTYRKRISDKGRVLCKVDVFALHVTGFAETWPEQGQRRSCWVPLGDAASLVEEPGLAGLLRRLRGSPLVSHSILS